MWVLDVRNLPLTAVRPSAGLCGFNSSGERFALSTGGGVFKVFNTGACPGRSACRIARALIVHPSIAVSLLRQAAS
jgi:hypothetical protein